MLLWLVAGAAALNHKRLSRLLNAPALAQAELDELCVAGSMEGFYTLGEVAALVEALSAKYPHFVEGPFTIGQSSRDQNITAFRVGRLSAPSPRATVLLTALHHAREPVSLTLLIRYALSSLHRLLHPAPGLDAFDVADLLFVPAVNVDGYRSINEAFGTPRWQKERNRRKNEDPGAVCPHRGVDSGVDLNRNYDVQFDADEVGSVGADSCDDTYRGPAAFSEPETRAVRSLFEGGRFRISAALNFHAYGNMWIHPYNHYPGADNDALMSAGQAGFFRRFGAEARGLGVGLFGNAQATIHYTANGEASDWMMKAHGAVALSPELGDGTPESDVFYPPRHKAAQIAAYSEKLVEVFVGHALPRPQNVLFRASEGRDNHRPLFRISFENGGIADVPDVRLRLRCLRADLAPALHGATLISGAQRTPLQFAADEKDPAQIAFSPTFTLQKLESHALLLQLGQHLAVRCQLEVYKDHKLLFELRGFGGTGLADIFAGLRGEKRVYLLFWLLTVLGYTVSMVVLSFRLSRDREVKKTRHILEFVNVIRAEVEETTNEQNMSFQSYR